ncbi:MAG: hypothetical protein VKK42_19210 [Lyngbya sp.]|nr:hypothetical protein [Lyngbya sp.]
MAKSRFPQIINYCIVSRAKTRWDVGRINCPILAVHQGLDIIAE